MKLAIIFGAFAPSDGNGLVDLGKRLGMPFDLYHESDEIKQPYDAYIGHSFGGDRALATIQAFPDQPVEYLALIDPVKKGWLPFFWLPALHFKIPANVKRADCFKRNWAFLPPSSKILNPSATFVNYTISSSHGEAPRNATVIEVITKQLRS